jgi:hypothetical protein
MPISINCLKFTLKRIILNCYWALRITLLLLSVNSLANISISPRNLEGGLFFIMTWFPVMKFERPSRDLSLFYQSPETVSFRRDWYSSITMGSTGFEIPIPLLTNLGTPKPPVAVALPLT